MRLLDWNMAVHFTLLLLLSALPVVISLFSAPFHDLKAYYRPENYVEAGPGDPVFLTPYIKAGQLDQGTCTA